MNATVKINSDRLRQRLDQLATIGVLDRTGVSRLALTDADKQGRDLAVSWMKALGLTVHIDEVGNIIGLRRGEEDLPPVMVGSHLDTVTVAGRFDGSYGVLAGLECVRTLNDNDIRTRRPVAVAAFTNEEGVRYAPGMLGSAAYSGALPVDGALATTGFDGSVFGEELERIGYAGKMACGEIKPYAYLELHVEQGPILDQLRIPIGAVETVVGISWQEVTVLGAANHAGTTPIELRHDAGLAAAKIISYVRDLAVSLGGNQRATCGMIAFKPNAINVIPGEAVFTVDLRNSDDSALQQAENRLATFLIEVAAQEGVSITPRQLERIRPVQFHPGIVEGIEQSARSLGYPSRRMISGAGHDAQLMARICPTAMIFVPSKEGISHSPAEYTPIEELGAGADVLLGTLLELADREGELEA
jgi:N-carbamoyl-L-amino-acid hydrolase